LDIVSSSVICVHEGVIVHLCA